MRFLSLQNLIVKYALHSRSLLSGITEKTQLIGTLLVSFCRGKKGVTPALLRKEESNIIYIQCTCPVHDLYEKNSDKEKMLHSS